ncbi:hypothetical protein ScPMuIL_012574 [Solemya velum]
MEFGHPHPFSNSESVIQASVMDVMNEMIDEATLGISFEVHRACKLGTLFLGDTDPKSEKDHMIVDKPGIDVFGQIPTKKQFECVCPNCQRHLAASRFAPHLEKCMGMGRNSSRIASRRIANTSSKRDSDDSPEDNDNDSDWSYHVDRKVKKLKKDKTNNSPRRNKSSKLKNGDTGIENTGTPESNIPTYEQMTIEERKALLLQTCGVISEHTKKMCTRTHRCPQHTDDQRKQVRQFLLVPQGCGGDDDIQIDIDSYDDADSQSLREHLQWEVASSNSSPTDSTSTNNSTSSKKRAGQKSGSSKVSMNKKKKPPRPPDISTASVIPGSTSSLYDFV